MKILLFGSNGQVGSALIGALPPHHQLIAPAIDITDDVRLRDIINNTLPDIIINAAAYTNVDGAEENQDSAFQVNAHAPRVMAEIAREKNIQLIHYSTDYVFDGSGNRTWVETDAPSPLNIYGQSKLMGESHIIESDCRHLIFRTSWVYGTSGENFITKMIELSKTRDEIKVISDQIGAPTSARFIADATYHAIEQPDANGLYHLCCAGHTSWYEYARLVVGENCRVTPILSADYPQKARRPLNSRLNCEKFIADFSLIPPDWQAECLENIPIIFN